MSEGHDPSKQKSFLVITSHGIKAERRAVTGFVRSADYL